MIDLTPIEVRKKKGDFRRALRGYEPALVDDFLDLAADRLEQLIREHLAQKERLAELERRVNEYRDRERALTDALVSAQEMREEIRVQSEREAQLALKTSTQESEARLRDAEQRSETLLREAEQNAATLQRDAEQLVREAEERSQTMLREAEQRAQTLVRESEQHAATTVRAAEQGADDTLRRAQQEAEAELLDAQQEADRLRSGLVQVREREEEALRQLRSRQQQHLTSYRLFLERELAELENLTETLGIERDAEAGEELGGAPADREPGLPRHLRDSRAAAAAAVLAQSFLAGDTVGAEEDASYPAVAEAESSVPDVDLEPFEPEPVYEEDIEPRQVGPEASDASDVGLGDLTLTEPGEVADGPLAPEPELESEDTETSILLENAELAGYNLDLDGELAEEPELLLEEPASQDGEDDDDWLSSIIGSQP